MIAPNFDVTDIEGQRHNLQDYLNQGKVVILEFCTTWSEACWDYEQIGALNATHKLLGPEGLDQAIVLLIESDPGNSSEQLYGIDDPDNINTTEGNWVEHTQYPIIDNADIAALFSVEQYPTIYKICPKDNIAYCIDKPLKDELVDVILTADCAVPSRSKDVAILQYNSTPIMCSDTPSDIAIEIVNLGSENTATIQMQLYNDLTLLETISLDNPMTSFDRKTLTFDNIALLDYMTLNFELISEGDEDFSSNIWSQTIKTAPEVISNEITLEFKMDRYGHEFYWEIRDYNGVTHASGGNQAVGIDGGGGDYINEVEGLGSYISDTIITEYVTLPSEETCYELVLVDDYGDGICCQHGAGYYRIIDESETVLLEGGHFSDYAIEPFSLLVNRTSTRDQAAVIQAKISPNPARDFINIALPESINSIVDISIYNAQGKQVAVATEYAGVANLLNMNVSNLSAGVYFVDIRTMDGIQFYAKFSITAS